LHRGLNLASRCTGRRRLSGPDPRRVDQHLLHHQRSAKFDKADNHQEENGGNDREFGRRSA
jgi:hypothetical protein